MARFPGDLLAKKSSVEDLPPKQEDKFMRFERARIIGARALQIAMGAPIILTMDKGFIDPVGIAEREYAENLVPITVIRPDNMTPRRKKPGITVQPKFMRRV